MDDKPVTVPLYSRPKMSQTKGTNTSVGRCPVAHKSRDPEDLEHDFTTPGKVGNLECPFAKMAQNGLPHTPNSLDPIAAEFHQDHVSVTSQGGLGKCPIRFLDKHSPEEIAQYFENHKHEIPRSHEVCVRRYQSNQDSVRALDAKYGSLVNMIQGLGVKHKQFLPHEIPTEPETASNNAIEKWAENISNEAQAPQADSRDESRASHFDRPLREVRVGESPSRPWGISVPVDKPAAASALGSGGNVPQQPISPEGFRSPPVVGIPQSLLQNKTKSMPGQTTGAVHSSHDEEQSSKPPQQIIFNGPVFFGYSAEDAAKLLQTLNVNNLRPHGA